MANDLVELGERIDFAREEIETLRKQIADFCKVGLSVNVRDTPGRDTLDLYLMQSAPVPTAIRSRAGTTANELRSCLDGLACVLAIRNGKTPSGTYFPISKSATIFEDDGRKKMKKIANADQDTIEALRPYKDGHPLLFPLHEADRTRKHQRLAACGGVSKRAEFGIGGISMGGKAKLIVSHSHMDGVFIEHMEYGGGTISGAGQETLIASGVPPTLPMQIIGGISYADPPELAGWDVERTLTQFADVVSEIIRKFE